MDSPISLRKAEPKDESDLAELFLISAPLFVEPFKKDARKVLRTLFSLPRNLFSFEHVCFAGVSGEIAGMVLSYSAQTHRREYLRTGVLLFKSLVFKMIRIFHVLLRFNSHLGKLGKGDYYISNLAVYPRFRSVKIGKALMQKAEKRRKKRRFEQVGS
ncbi:GNAT family N-acetyltransferase [Pseudothermotoga sp.]